MSRLCALLVAPPLLERTYPGKPMALDYLAAVLYRERWDVRSIDVDIEGVEHYIRLLKTEHFDLIGITAMSIQVDEANKLALLARELAPNAVVIRGGAHDTYSYDESCFTHRDVYDAFVLGEGEETLRDIARAIKQGTFYDNRGSIRGMAFRNGESRFTGYRPPVDVSKTLPLRLFHHPSYNFDVFQHRKTAQVMATRGCSNACFYCSESVAFHGRHEFRRNLDSVRREFAELRQKGYEAIYFDDPTFTRDRGWVIQLCEELSRWGFVWGCNTRVDCLDDDLVRRMRVAGCKYLFCGFESAAPEILLAMNKTPQPGAYLESAIRSYSALRRNRIPCSAFLIFGCPRREQNNGHAAFGVESDKDVRDSLQFAINTLDPDYLSMNILRLLPGLPFSFAPQFSCVRPTGEAPIHGGYYDSTWYKMMGIRDLRSQHPIFRAFEGCGSVNPVQMTPERCYDILSLAVEMVNSKNATLGKHQTKIVVDRRFAPFLKEEWRGRFRRYLLVPFSIIEESAMDFPRQFDHQDSRATNAIVNLV